MQYFLHFSRLICIYKSLNWIHNLKIKKKNDPEEMARRFKAFVALVEIWVR